MIESPSRPDLDDDAPELGDELDLQRVTGSSLAVFEDGLSGLRDPRVDEGAGAPLTGAAERCITRFALHEADVTSAELAGLGRVSSVRFPRLGGVLHGRVTPGGHAAALLTVGAERTVRAGYRAALATHEVANVPIEHVDVEDLWDAFLPASYRIPRAVAATAWDICRFDEFWVQLLVTLGLEGDATRLGNGRVSPLSRSIRGLSTVGVALALTERGGRHDRFVGGRRAARGHRREGGTLPPAPRTVVDDAD
jgi:hypothetical protein